MIIGALVVVAATVTEGVLLMTFAEELRVRDQTFGFRCGDCCCQDQVASSTDDNSSHHHGSHSTRPQH